MSSDSRVLSAPDAPYDASNPEAVKKKEGEARLRQEQMRTVESDLLKSRQGREWVWQILQDCKVFEKRIAMSGSENENGFFEGQREVGLQLLRRLATSCPKQFALMMAENG